MAFDHEEAVREMEYWYWRDDHYTEMNDGTYQDHEGRNVDEAAMRKHYDGQRELEGLQREDSGRNR